MSASRVIVTAANGQTRPALLLEAGEGLALVRFGDHTRALVPARDVRPNTRERNGRKGVDNSRQ